MEKLTVAQRNEIVMQARKAGDLMTEIDFERIPVALLNGCDLDWLDESYMRKKWARFLESKNLTLSEFNNHARVAVKYGLMILEGKNTASIGGVEELLKPLDFDKRIHLFTTAK